MGQFARAIVLGAVGTCTCSAFLAPSSRPSSPRNWMSTSVANKRGRSEIGKDSVKDTKISGGINESVGRIKYYGGRSQWRKAEDNFQAILESGVEPTPAAYNAMLLAYQRSGRYRETRKLLDEFEIAQKNWNGKTPGVDSYNALIGAFAAAGKWNQAMQTAEPLLAAGGMANADTFLHLIEACGKGGQIQRIPDLLDDMSSRGIELTAPVTSCAMMHFASLRTKDGAAQAFEVMDRLIRSGAPPDAEVYRAAVNACAGIGDWTRAVGLIDEMRSIGLQADDRTYGSVLRACSAASNWQLCMALLNTMGREGVKRKAYHYNVSMGACNKAGKPKMSMKLFAELQSAGIPGDLITYNTAIGACAAAKDLTKALELVKEAKDKGLSPDSYTYGSILAAARSSGDWEKSIYILQDMKKEGLNIDERCYATVMATCLNADMPDRVLEIRDSMLAEDGIEVGIGSGLQVLRAYAALGDWLKALDELKRLKNAGHSANEDTLCAAMRACTKAKRWQEAADLYKEAKQLGVPLGTSILTTASSAFDALGDYEAAGEVLKSIKNQPNLKLNPAVLLNAARAYARGGKWKEAIARLDEMEAMESGLKAGRSTFDFITSALHKAGEHQKVLDICTRSRSAGHTLSYTVSAWEIEAAGTCNDQDALKQALSHASVSSQSQSVSYYNTVILACIECSLPDIAISTFKDMQKYGVIPDGVTYCSLMGVAKSLGNPRGSALCTALVKDAQRRGMDAKVLARVMRAGAAACSDIGSSSAAKTLGDMAIEVEEKAAVNERKEEVKLVTEEESEESIE